MDDRNAATRERLRDIAGLLGVETERFYETAPTPSPEATAELNYLWHRLRTPAGRVAALNALNKILDSEGT